MEKKKARGMFYGLVITDCSMPRMTGYELSTKIRSYHYLNKFA